MDEYVRSFEARTAALLRPLDSLNAMLPALMDGVQHALATVSPALKDYTRAAVFLIGVVLMVGGVAFRFVEVALSLAAGYLIGLHITDRWLLFEANMVGELAVVLTCTLTMFAALVLARRYAMAVVSGVIVREVVRVLLLAFPLPNVGNAWLVEAAAAMVGALLGPHLVAPIVRAVGGALCAVAFGADVRVAVLSGLCALAIGSRRRPNKGA